MYSFAGYRMTSDSQWVLPFVSFRHLFFFTLGLLATKLCNNCEASRQHAVISLILCSFSWRRVNSKPALFWELGCNLILVIPTENNFKFTS